jgi:hypothetical protein
MGTLALVVLMVMQDGRQGADKTAAARTLFFIKILLVFTV